MTELKSENYKPFAENPFICNSSRKVRIGLGKAPRVFKGDTQLLHQIEMENGNILLHNETDDKLSFTFGKCDVRDDFKDIINIDKYDYNIPLDTLNANAKIKHTEPLPVSFIQIKTEELKSLKQKLNH